MHYSTYLLIDLHSFNTIWNVYETLLAGGREDLCGWHPQGRRPWDLPFTSCLKCFVYIPILKS